MQRLRLGQVGALAAGVIVAACGAPAQSGSGDGGGDFVESADGSFVADGSSGGGPHGDGGGSGGSEGGGSSGDGGEGSSGSPITCPAPGSYTKNGGACGTERWDIKTGTDPYTSSVSLVPKPNTIAALGALAAAGGGTNRESPTETTVWQLTDVTLTELKSESDSDYHMVLSDGTHTMVAEIPYPDCASGGVETCFISRARAEVDARYTVTSSPVYPALTVTLRGVGFFDYPHGQTGDAPNSIELHPTLQICFGKGCTPT